MIDKIALIKKELENPLKELELMVYDVSYEKKNNYNILNIVLDRVNGIDIDTIVKATNVINPLIDKLDLFEEEYVLDISSRERGK